jgi:DNA-binding CsgD family transcriptional regulator
MTTTGDSARGDALTNREQHVVALAGRGLSNQEIADRLSISARTVKCTLHRASVRLGAHNRVQAVLFALRRGIISITDVYSMGELEKVLDYLPPELLEAIYQRVDRDNGTARLVSGTAGHDGGNGAGRSEEDMECVCS